ncbi:hypothetical protein CAPTEDRAFT_183840 [Capitella teleta]|uniref:UBX domain-containing protein n=1 Tax=Capitella teleta TaxID=283909 RepID=R7THL7_CAPTE|nr:hypothetical protein CAPTEDRAFT_183840 [Capitella teleta]|eukprot:ELT93214.1 hypothetical protein CAPTEDRAFT_183840 [Capitella teleta]
MAEREQILADFQACTGNENIEECIVILEQHEWNLMEAVQAAMSGDFDSPRVGSPPIDISPPNGVNPPSYLDAVHGASAECLAGPLRSADPGGSASLQSLHERIAHQVAFASTSLSPPIRLLNFNIEYRDRSTTLRVPDSETIGKIKVLLESQWGIPVAKQDLCGWVDKANKRITDSDVLRDLHLPLDTTLFLLTPELMSTSQDSASESTENTLAQRLDQMYSLNIEFTNTHKDFQLNFFGRKTIQEVKQDLFSLTDVPVRYQQWHGWPEGASDSTTLAEAGLQLPSHRLLLMSNRPSNENEETADAESIEDFEDAHDSFVEDSLDLDGDGPLVRRPEPLMMEDAANQTEALESFSHEFGSRYGDCHPVFYIGDLECAIKDSLLCRAKDRKLLAIYLHHDASIQANVFCSQILCTESVVSFLSANFITWGWDLTSPANRARLLTMCTRHFGSIATNTVQNLRPDELPLLLIISRNRGSNEVMQAIHGNTTLDELMTHLLHATEVFREQQTLEIQEEDERNARETMLAEQDAAYQESLAVDRAKEEAKRIEEEQRRERENREQRHLEDLEKDRQHEMAQKEAIRQSLSDQLPDEPPCNCTEPISTLRIRCPGGGMLVRRFLAQHPLQVLLNFVASKGFPCSEFKLLTTFPRKDLTLEDTRKTLQVLKLCPQETLIVEEK